MGLFPVEHETIEGVGREIRHGSRTCVDVLERCLDRIAEWEGRLKAWVLVDRVEALEQAHALDRELAAGKCRGPLHGIPVGIKDIIDVAGLPTAAGFRPWAGRIAPRDAGIVASLREAGAVIVGKTVTTQFAWIDPPPTRNPWNLARTPGGSSSGSAAAVACGMCLGAIGTQTGGSIIRPASYCGVAGLKPTHTGQLDGILPFAPHLDHPGPIARSVRDLTLMFLELGRSPSAEPVDAEAVDSEVARVTVPRQAPPRLGCPRGFFQTRLEPAMRRAFDETLGHLAAAGAEVVDLADPFEFDRVIRDHRVIMAAEAAEGHSARLAQSPADYLPRIRELIDEGRGLAAVAYLAARRHQDELRASLAERASGVDALVMPATLGPAPDPATTGNPVLNSPWSFTGSPVVSFPMALSPDGLPMAIQLIEPRPLAETDLLATAAWCEDVVRRAERARRP